MTDPIHEQISSFLDGELPAAESELLLKRLERDAQLRNTMGRFALIGDALRSTEAGGPTRDFAARVSRAIEQEAAPGKRWRPVANWLKPVAGGAIAAGVAAVALVSLRVAPVNQPDAIEAVNSPSAPTLIPVQEESADAQRDLGSPRGYTVPVINSNVPPAPIQVINGGKLANFVMAHSEYSTPLNRRNVLTSLLAEEAIDQNDAVEQPAIESSPVATRSGAHNNSNSPANEGLKTR